MLWFAARMPGLEERYAAMLAAASPVFAAVPVALGIAVPDMPPQPVLVQTRVVPAEKVVQVGKFVLAGKALPASNAVTPAQHVAHRPNVEAEGRYLRAADGIGDGLIAVPIPVPQGAAPAITPAHELATQAYARLAASDRRASDRLFAAAIAAAPDGAPNLSDWVREHRRINRRWSGDAYVLFRDAGVIPGAAASPVLGSGQSGSSIAFTPDPLANRPVAAIARIFAAHGRDNRIDGATAQAAIGIRWQLRSGISVAVERLIPIGRFTSADWNLRIAAGGERRLGLVYFEAYGEGGARGNGDVYAGGQVRAEVPVGTLLGLKLGAGPGIWSSIQTGPTTVSRVDLGVGVAGRLPARAAVNVDWRWRVAGNAAPVSGPAVTVSMAF